MWGLVPLLLHAATTSLPPVTVRHSTNAPWQFDIDIDGERWFSNDAVWFRTGGVTYSTPGGPKLPGKIEPLVATGSATTTSGDDGFGRFTSVAIKWKAGAATVITSVRNYSTGTVIFGQSFPDGLEHGDWLGDINGVSTGFPSFRPETIGAGGGAATQRRWMAYNGWDCTNLYGCVTAQKSRVAMGLWDNTTAVLPQGAEGSGPIAIMAADGSKTVVISAASSFMAQSQQFIPNDTPVVPPPPLSSFTADPDSYCNTGHGHHYTFTANNITVEQCLQHCADLGCLAFEYSPGAVRPQPYCQNCRVVGPTDRCDPTHSGQNYTLYRRPIAPAPPAIIPGVLSYGVMGTIASVPERFSLEVILSVGAGPNDAVRGWGKKMTTAYNKTNPRNKDFTTTHLGYDTDNGAYYYYSPEAGKTYDQTLMDVHAYAATVGIPYHHVQLDSWWYIKAPGRGGTVTWTPDKNTFPDGLASFHERSGWNITAHNRMWSSKTTYAEQNGGKFKWLIEGTEAVPLEQGFWNYLMAQGKAWGLYVYEQDWLFTEWIGTNATLASATLATEWLRQMATGAEEQGLVIQYCMLWPRMALQSLEFAAVTTARGSTDYDAGSDRDQWIMGPSSLFLDSLALRPTKDNFFSTDKQPTKSKGVERFNRLQGLVSTLSTGPVFPSDGIGSSDVPLILRSCNAGGVLLRPDRAATSLDSNILAKALARGTGAPEPGELESSSSTVSTGNHYADGAAVHTYLYLLAAQTNATTIQPGQLIPGYSGAPKYLAVESNSTAVAVAFGPAPLKLPATNRWNFNFWTFAPVLENGYAFFGEVATKWIAVSNDRFAKVVATSAGLEVDAVGTPGEVVVMAWVPPGNVAVMSMECTVSGSGSFTARIPAKTCH